MAVATDSLLGHDVWHVDRSRSAVEFRVRHFGVATVRGRFQSFGARVDGSDGRPRVAGHVDAASVDTGNAIRDSRLRTEFFDVEDHPAIALEGELRGDRLRGSLTIRGVTRPMVLDAAVSPLGDDAIAVRATGSLSRSEFGLQWAALREGGRLLVADMVHVTVDVVLVRRRQMC